MDVISHAGPRHGPKVRAQVEAVRRIGRLDRAKRLLGERHQLLRGLPVEAGEIGGVEVGSDHHVAARVGIAVQHHEAPLAPAHDQRRLVVELRLRAEDAFVGLVAPDVGDPPGSPKSLGRQGPRIVQSRSLGPSRQFAGRMRIIRAHIALASRGVEGLAL